MKTAASGWFRWQMIFAVIFTATTFTGCSQDVAGVGTGGTGSIGAKQYPMGGAIQGTELSLSNSVTTIAGNTSTVAGTPSSADGIGAAARFNMPWGITTDGTNLYVLDFKNDTIRKIEIATGTVSTLAGTAGYSGWEDGIGASAGFAGLQGITTDGENLFVTEYGYGSKVRKIVIATGEVTTLAGSTEQGAVDGVGTSARFNFPTGITVNGNELYVTDSFNHTIRKIDKNTGAVTTFAGATGIAGNVDGTGFSARFGSLGGITTDGTNLYVTDFAYGGMIRKIVISTGIVTTMSKGLLVVPTGVVIDGNCLYVADTQSQQIMKISLPDGAVTTFAGAFYAPGSVDGNNTDARFSYPRGITSDGANLYVTDTYNNTIRQINIATRTVTTLAGLAPMSGTTTGSSGAGTGSTSSGSSASFFDPIGITTDGTNLYISDFGSSTIRKVVVATGAVTTIAGALNVMGAVDGTGTSSRFNHPWGITTDGRNVYVADGGSTIRSIHLATGAVTTLAGNALQSGSMDGIGTSARFNGVGGITTDGTSLYVTDSANGTIRKIEIATGTVTTLAGKAGTFGSADGTGSAASFTELSGITTDGTSVYVADLQTVRKIDISSGSVTTVAGTAGVFGRADGTGTAALFDRIFDITTDGTSLYLTDANNTIRKIVISTGAVTTIAGGTTGSANGVGASASFRYPRGITTDGVSLYIADTSNNTIRAVR